MIGSEIGFVRSPKSIFNSKIEDRARAYGDQWAAARRSGASVESVERLRASFVLPTKALFHVCHLRRMGYMLARPCRRCGCGIAVNSVQLKIDKDAAGVDQHKYSTVCERALESLRTPAQAPAALGTTFRQRLEEYS